MAEKPESVRGQVWHLDCAGETISVYGRASECPSRGRADVVQQHCSGLSILQSSSAPAPSGCESLRFQGIGRPALKATKMASTLGVPVWHCAHKSTCRATTAHDDLKQYKSRLLQNVRSVECRRTCSGIICSHLDRHVGATDAELHAEVSIAE